ncbi:MAG: hypothetical protein RR331_06820 [Bacteroides sp.]
MKKWSYIIGALLFFFFSLPLCLGAQTDFSRQVSLSADNDTLNNRAKMLHAAGRDSEAIHYFKRVKEGRDSAQLQLLTRQMEQVKRMHNIYVLQAEKEHKAYSLQLFILSFLLASILTLICYFVYAYRVRRKLKHEEAEMRELTREVEAVNLTKNHFLSNISEFVACPLDKVVESSLLLSSQHELDDEQRNELSDSISKTSAQLMRLINDILDLSRLEAGMMKFMPSDIELFSLVGDAAAVMSVDKNEKIEVECPQNALCWIHIDGNRLRTVFQNLFACPLSGSLVRVIVEPYAASGEILVTVYNTALAKHELSQELIILNEVNRMIVNHFGGLYEMHSDAPEPYVYLTLKGSVTRLEL